MATWNTDKPAIANQVTSDIPDIEENFQELHDVIEQLTQDTLGTTEPANFKIELASASRAVVTDASSKLGVSATTAAEIVTLADNSIADTLHRHSELVSLNGSVDPVVTLDNDGIVTITLNSDTIVFRHDGTNAHFNTSDGSFIFQTTEGTNTATYLDVYGKGTEVGYVRGMSPTGNDYVAMSHDDTDAYFNTNDGSFKFITDEVGGDTTLLVDGEGAGTGYVDTDAYKSGGTQVLGAQQAAEGDLGASGDMDGSDTVNEATLETALSNIETKVNNILAKLRTHGIIAT